MTSDSLVSTVTAAPSAAGPGCVGLGERQQVRVAVVEDPVLRPGQERREPPAHRPAAAGEVVDDQGAAGRQTATEVPDELSGPGCSVRALAQVEPARG